MSGNWYKGRIIIRTCQTLLGMEGGARPVQKGKR